MVLKLKNNLGYLACFITVLTISIFAIGVNDTIAANLYYVGTGDAYATAANWHSSEKACDGAGDAGAPPGSSDVVFLTASCTTALTIPDSTSVNGISLNASYGSTVTQGGSFDLGVMIISAGTTFDSAGFALTVSDNWTNSGTYTSGANTVTFDGTGAQTLQSGGTTAGDDFNNLTISNTSSSVSLTSDALDVDGNLIIDSGAIFSLDGLDATVTGTVDNNGTFQLVGGETVSLTMDTASGTVLYEDGAGGTHTELAAGDNYYNLTIDDSSSGSSYTLDAALDVNNNFTTSNTSTVVTGGFDINIGGDWSNASGATFTHGSAEVIFDGSSQTMAGDTTFFDIDKRVTSSDTFTLTAGDTFTVSGTLTAQGTSGGSNLQLISSSSGSVANLDVNGTDAVSYVTAQDITNAGSETIACAQGCLNNGNNTGWNFTSSTTGGGGGAVVNTVSTVNVVSPNGGEVLYGGDEALVEWSASGESLDSISVSYTSDGIEYVEVVTGLENTGSYLWIVPNVDSDSAKIRISTVSSSGSQIMSDDSNQSFSIVAITEEGEVEVEELQTELPENVSARMENVDGEIIDLVEGMLFRGVELSGVYMVKDGTRYVFPTSAVFESYGFSYDDVMMMKDDQLKALRVGGRMTMDTGSLIKIQSDNRVYEVQEDGSIVHIQDESTAVLLFGTNWSKLVVDISESFWFDYSL